MILTSNPAAQTAVRRAAIDAAIARVLSGARYVLGPETEAFEEEFAAFCGVAHAVGVANGTDALALALRAHDVGPGTEVITVSHTALATIAAVLMTGATPVLVDIDPATMTMDPVAAERAITSRTRALLPVHLYGCPADLGRLRGVAERHRLILIEDCAQAHGGMIGARKVGGIGHAGCFSFYPTKNLGAIGDGGAIVTNDATTAARLKRLRQYGWDSDRLGQETGVNSRLDELQAAILRVKLGDLEADTVRRGDIAQAYTAALSGRAVQLPAVPADVRHAYHLYVIRWAARDRLQSDLGTRGIQAGIHYAVPAHRHPGYEQHIRVPSDGLPVTDRAAREVLSLPMYPELSAAEIAKVTQSLKDLVPTR